jgi:rhamnosyltransferase
MQTVSVLIPTLNASQWLPMQLAALHAQTVEISEIVIIDSQSEDDTYALASTDPLCRVIPILKSDFDHGATRDFAARTCNSEYLWFLTQDAIPADENCLEELIKAIHDEDIACAYGRQIVSDDATRIEQLNRLVNYPTQGFVRSAEDIPSLQIRTFFLSNTCCLYKRDIYLRCGGFQHNLPMNEDMLIAAGFIRQGYRTAYCANARVWHMHHMTLKQWYQRSFDTGAFMEMYSRELNGVKAYGVGKKYVFFVIRQLLREGRILSFLFFDLICAVRLLGDCDGHRYMNLSKHSILRRTQNPVFWQRYMHDNCAAYTSDTKY